MVDAMHPTDIVLDHPWVAPALWIVLHSLDYSLTLVGARLRLRGADKVFVVEGSYELNPLFQKVIDRQRWISVRFIVTLLGLAAALYVVALTCPGHDVADGLGLVLGVVVFTRVAVIGRHLHNIWLYRRVVRRPDAVTGSIRYDRPTVYAITSSTYLHYAVLLALAAAVVSDPWIIGGALGNAMIALYSSILGWRSGRRQSRAVSAIPSTSPDDRS